MSGSSKPPRRHLRHGLSKAPELHVLAPPAAAPGRAASEAERGRSGGAAMAEQRRSGDGAKAQRRRSAGAAKAERRHSEGGARQRPQSRFGPLSKYFD